MDTDSLAGDPGERVDGNEFVEVKTSATRLPPIYNFSLENRKTKTAQTCAVSYFQMVSHPGFEPGTP
jgi:hypothetical protein